MVITRLTRAHDRAGFDCGEESLNRFLREQARKEAERDLGVTFVVTPDDAPTILGYYTLTMSGVTGALFPDAQGLPSQRVIPVALLGRLAVDNRCKGQRMGERLLFDALYRAERASAELGTFAVVVDALHEQARAFYEKYGFECLEDSPLHLFMPMKKIRKLGLQPMFSRPGE